MKGKFNTYVLWPLAKRVQNWIVDWSTEVRFAGFFPLDLLLHIAICKSIGKETGKTHLLLVVCLIKTFEKISNQDVNRTGRLEYLVHVVDLLHCDLTRFFDIKLFLLLMNALKPLCFHEVNLVLAVDLLHCDLTRFFFGLKRSLCFHEDFLTWSTCIFGRKSIKLCREASTWNWKQGRFRNYSRQNRICQRFRILQYSRFNTFFVFSWFRLWSLFTIFFKKNRVPRQLGLLINNSKKRQEDRTWCKSNLTLCNNVINISFFSIEWILWFLFPKFQRV